MLSKPFAPIILTLVLGAGLAAAIHHAYRLPNVTDSTGAVTLPNGWKITPAGTHIKLPGDLPMKMALTDNNRLLVLTAGYHDHSLNVVDVHSHELAASLDVVKAWDGMAFDSTRGTVYLSGGGQAKRGFSETLARLGLNPAMKADIEKPILRARYADGKLSPLPALNIAGLAEKDRYIAGLALGPRRGAIRAEYSDRHPVPAGRAGFHGADLSKDGLPPLRDGVFSRWRGAGRLQLGRPLRQFV